MNRARPCAHTYLQPQKDMRGHTFDFFIPSGMFKEIQPRYSYIYIFYIYIFFSCTFRTKFNLIPKGETLRSLHRHKSAWLHHFEMQTCGWTHIHPYRQTAKKVSGACLCILIPRQPARLGRYLIFPACSADHRGGLAGTQRQIYDKSLLPLWFTAVIGPG